MMKPHGHYSKKNEEPALLAHSEAEKLVQNLQNLTLKFCLTLENQPAGNVT